MDAGDWREIMYAVGAVGLLARFCFVESLTEQLNEQLPATKTLSALSPVLDMLFETRESGCGAESTSSPEVVFKLLCLHLDFLPAHARL